MTDREWQPGEFALVTTRDDVTMRAVCIHGGVLGNADFMCEDGVIRDNRIDEARLIAAIDTEDREDIAGLLSLYWADRKRPYDVRSPEAYPQYIDAMQVALREHAAPKSQKPVEPRRAGAVVEDASGDWWACLTRGATGAVWHRIGVPEKRAPYRAIDAVRVLSEGVQR